MITNVQICGLMLAYFKADMTLNCLKTLENQGIKKIILIDNSASLEENKNTLALINYFPTDWLKVVISPENLGFAKGMNLALRLARQITNWDFFLILNNDLVAQPNLVEKLSHHMRHHPEIAMITTATHTPNGVHRESYYHRWTGLIFNRHVYGSFLFLGGHCLLIRSQVINKHLFNECYFMYGEDIELNWCLTKQGWQLTVLPDVLLTHNSGSSSSNGSLFYEYHVNRWHLLITKALTNNLIEQIIMLIFRLPILILRAIWRSWKFRNVQPIKALLLASLTLPIRPSPKN